MRNEKLHTFGLALTAAAIAAADQLSKYLIGKHSPPGWPWPGIFEFTDHRNYGLVANLPVPLFLILAVTLAVTALIIHHLFIAKRPATSGEDWALAAVLGGAIGNLTDRLRLGYVHDWAMFFGISIINLADVAIAVGLLWYAACLWRGADKRD